MCGIAGFIGENNQSINTMLQALVHRGPDGNATYVGSGISFGHARLAILDPTPVGDQPMWNDSGTVVMVYNGEIFNYRELKAAEKFDCKTGTDTEVLLRLYDRYGIGFLSKLRGMFAFGLYDTRKQTLFLARDSSGIKPLFIARINGKLHFASEMRSLLQAFPSKPALDIQSLCHYLRLQYVPGPETLCEGITSLPAGTLLTSTARGEQRDMITPDVSPIPFASKQEFTKQFPLLMERVVHDHMISDRPIGIFLSGGMDSSIVLHHMASQSTQPVKTFTVRFEATEDEDQKRFNRDADLAQMSAKYYGTDHHEILITAQLCHDVYADCAKALDQPNADSVAMAQFVLAHEAKKHVDVVLCGAGGDELFGGYPRYRIAYVLNALRAIAPQWRSKAAALLGYPPDVLGMTPGANLAERLLARPQKEIEGFAAGNWFQGQGTSDLFAKRFEKLHLHKDRVREFMEFDRRLWLVDESLRLNDAMTMARGVECRVPFLDPLIIEASHGTPSDWHVGPRRTKSLLKDTYRSILPKHLYSLSKASFYPPLAKWFRRECKPLVEHMLQNKRMESMFDMTRVRAIADDHMEHRQYGLHTLSTLTQLSYWFETVYDA